MPTMQGLPFELRDVLSFGDNPRRFVVTDIAASDDGEVTGWRMSPLSTFPPKPDDVTRFSSPASAR